VERPQELRELVVHQEDLRPRVPQDVADLVGRETRVDGDQDESRGGNAEVRLQHGGGVRRDDGNAIQLLQPKPPEGGGQPVHADLELAIGVASRPVDDGRSVREHVGAPPEERHRRQLGPVDLPLGADRNDAGGGSG